MSGGVGHRPGSAPAWLCHRPAATALNRPLAWELPSASSVALKDRQKGRKEGIDANRLKRRSHGNATGPFVKHVVSASLIVPTSLVAVGGDITPEGASWLYQLPSVCTSSQMTSCYELVLTTVPSEQAICMLIRYFCLVQLNICPAVQLRVPG